MFSSQQRRDAKEFSLYFNGNKTFKGALAGIVRNVPGIRTHSVEMHQLSVIIIVIIIFPGLQSVIMALPGIDFGIVSQTILLWTERSCQKKYNDAVN